VEAGLEENSAQDLRKAISMTVPDRSAVSHSPEITVALINYNGVSFLEELLRSLVSQTYKPFEILFIDNGSSDNSLEFVRSSYPGIQLIAQEENRGFAQAGNLAMRESTNEFVALLNTDLKLDPDWLKNLTAQIIQDDATAAVASKLRFYDRPNYINGVGGTMNRLGYTWDRGMNEEDRGQLDQPVEVLFASAGAVLFRRKTFQQVGGFDEMFFMYHEDVDLCWRLWLLGFQVLTSPAAVAYHHFGGATKKAKGMRWRELMGERNNMRSLLKNYELPNALSAITRMIFLKQPASRKLAQIRNLCWNLIHLPDTLRHRRCVQRRRVRSDNDLKHLIVQSNDVPVRL
jgi:GT2 family glycosyltransferase